MGLDNGIVLRRKDNQEFELPLSCCNKYENSIELCYWRKCYGIRNAIINKLHLSKEGGNYVVDIEDVPAIIRILKHFVDKDIWENEGESIWDYVEDDMKDTLIDDIIVLSKLIDWIKGNPNKDDYVLYFYDSY